MNFEMAVQSGPAAPRLCRKCGDRIPNRSTINGRQVHLQRRKFCLLCSPFGAHNTKRDDPARPAKRSRASYSLEQRRKHSRELLARKREIRRSLLSAAGSACVDCGYSKYEGALAFHHRDPKTKRFNLGVSNMRGKTMEELLAEAAKCDLLCMNCHCERHAAEHLKKLSK